MNYRKIVFDGYILGVSEVEKNGNIDEEAFDRLTETINSAPVPPDGFYYALRDADEEWELIQLIPDDPDLDDAEALEILLGGAE